MKLRVMFIDDEVGLWDSAMRALDQGGASDRVEAGFATLNDVQQFGRRFDGTWDVDPSLVADVYVVDLSNKRGFVEYSGASATSALYKRVPGAFFVGVTDHLLSNGEPADDAHRGLVQMAMDEPAFNKVYPRRYPALSDRRVGSRWAWQDTEKRDPARTPGDRMVERLRKPLEELEAVRKFEVTVGSRPAGEASRKVVHVLPAPVRAMKLDVPPEVEALRVLFHDRLTAWEPSTDCNKGASLLFGRRGRAMMIRKGSSEVLRRAIHLRREEGGSHTEEHASPIPKWKAEIVRLAGAEWSMKDFLDKDRTPLKEGVASNELPPVVTRHNLIGRSHSLSVCPDVNVELSCLCKDGQVKFGDSFPDLMVHQPSSESGSRLCLEWPLARVVDVPP